MLETNLVNSLAVFRRILEKTRGTERTILVSMLYVDVNIIQSKGETRKIRKAIQKMGFTYLSALPAR